MAKIKYKAQSNLYIGKFKISPGINEISDNDFNSLMLNKFFRHRVEGGIIDVVLAPLPAIKEEKKFDSESLRQISTKGLIRLVEESSSEEMLLWICENEKRERVVKLAKERLEAIRG